MTDAKIYGDAAVYGNRNPWDGAPHWSMELREMMGIIIFNQEQEMALSDDLNNAVTALTTGFAALDAAVTAELTAITAALANQADPAITAAVAQSVSNIGTITSKMATDAAALTASIPAATTVPPPATTPPVTTVPPTVTPPVIATPPVTDPNATPPSTPPPSASTKKSK
jgi:hypothetical protein